MGYNSVVYGALHKVEKTEITMEVCWWVQVSLEKKLENRPKIVPYSLG